jgi:hypothetical protein
MLFSSRYGNQLKLLYPCPSWSFLWGLLRGKKRLVHAAKFDGVLLLLQRVRHHLPDALIEDEHFSRRRANPQLTRGNAINAWPSLSIVNHSRYYTC